jgi:hypothetical protein
MPGQYAPVWDIDTDTTSWEPKKMMHKNTFWVISPGVAIQGFSAAIMARVESPRYSSHLFLFPWIQQRNVGQVNKHFEFIGQFKEVPWGAGTLVSCPFCSLLTPPFCTVFET